MRIKATRRGLVIPRSMLPAGVEEFVIERVGNQTFVYPDTPADDGAHPPDTSSDTEAPDDDPIWGLGKNPVTSGLTDASTNHDLYLYVDPYGADPSPDRG